MKLKPPVMPAEAGIQSLLVMPAQAGIQAGTGECWIPAFAGMTWSLGLRGNDTAFSSCLRRQASRLGQGNAGFPPSRE
jgi:hypothetical protein